MSELLPSREAGRIRESLLDYLTTTFALSDPPAQAALADFLLDPQSGIFRGPFVRLRLPFRPAEPGWQGHLDWTPPYTPYGHQAAAWARLTTKDLGPDKPRPLPTLVTTGTGSGKTEAFLYPILDHALRARRHGQRGIKALLLYPMNALANDQASRIADLLTSNPAFAGITAGLYVGQDGPERSMVTEDGLITDREFLRDDPPDLLLTNYKMLDQLLLRAADQDLWRLSATSLRYLVLDEFHTYDGAQGTDVAMLLRRLGIAIKSWWNGNTPVTDADRERPLGQITPVATSATLGDGDPTAMVDFATTVFGEPFDPTCVVGESRMSLAEWPAGADLRCQELMTGPTIRQTAADLLQDVDQQPDDATGKDLANALIRRLFTQTPQHSINYPEPLPASLIDTLQPADYLALTKAHPLIRDLAEAAAHAIDLADLTGVLATHVISATPDQATRLLTALLDLLTHTRAIAGRDALSVETHLWVREVTRVDRLVAAEAEFSWSDDGSRIDTTGQADVLPAIYCRHCGRSGWGVGLAQTGLDLHADDSAIRRNHAAKEGRFRALLDARREADDDRETHRQTEGLLWLDITNRQLRRQAPESDDRDYLEGRILPVLTQVGPEADDQARDDTCPSCGGKDGIRFLGSAIATLLSVTLSTLFGAQGVRAEEKKALVFTDSVQDAAHRAGFVEARSHTLTLRTALRDAIPTAGCTLDELADLAIKRAGKDPFARVRLVPPSVMNLDAFNRWWQCTSGRKNAGDTRAVRRRLALDLALEFGLQSRYGRTLAQTGSAVAAVEAGSTERMAALARTVLDQIDIQDDLAGTLDHTPDRQLAAWVRGLLEHMRESGAIWHEWFKRYIEDDGARYRIWGGRHRSGGMPAFPKGRSAPAFPRVGKSAGTHESLLDPVTATQGWFARWTGRCLHVPSLVGATLARMLLLELAEAGVLIATHTKSGAPVYAVDPARIRIVPAELADLAAGRHRLICPICHNQFPATIDAIDQLEGAPCLLVRCNGILEREAQDDNFYRRFYDAQAMRRIVAREHSSLLPDQVRLAYENEFKSGTDNPAAPNVLVATPTLEMGIDIGDLSTVLLGSLPRTVASYLQRIGRAGRLSGSSLALTFVTGRGEQLMHLSAPTEVIDGQVRPPATYLSAAEILRRQYVAFLIDQMARDPELVQPRRASDVIGSTEPGSFLAGVIERGETGIRQQVEVFLAAFGAAISDDAATSLRTWAAAPNGPGSSLLAETIARAAGAWTREAEELRNRLTTLKDSIPELERLAALPAATNDDKEALQLAVASRKLTNARIGELNGEHWIAVLERFGLLPNYTLIDDSVTLDVEVSWLDADSGEFQSEEVTFQRASANALREFVPGSTFYAQGMEIGIDAIDLGPRAERIRRWAYCPACGYAVELAERDTSRVLRSCPRCAGRGIADTRQHVDVVELTEVSANLRRDEAAIGEDTEDRRRTSFAIALAADLDPAGERKRWFIPDRGLAIAYFDRLTLRWLNLGRSLSYGPGREIAGEAWVAPMFRVCGSCGQLDLSTDKNVAREHRPWCRYRKGTGDNVQSIALSRTLVTEGLVVQLPQEVTLDDRFALPSLQAAFLLGMRERFGGAPDHIGIAPINQPLRSQQGRPTGDVIPALLLYDTVRGGTGYLAGLAEPSELRAVFEAALTTVSDCECRSDERLACEKCLVPFTRSGELDYTSRAVAERHLRQLLYGQDRDDSDTADGDGKGETTLQRPVEWEITESEPIEVSHESHLEKRLRKLLLERFATLGAQITERPGEWGNIARITVPGSGRTWTLNPQPRRERERTRPDFALTTSDTSVPNIVIYADGYAYHASPQNNRLADDADKRAKLRSAGDVVVAITADDVEHAADGRTEPWYDATVAGNVLQESTGFSSTALTEAARGPIAFILDWVQRTDVEDYRRLAQAAPMLLLRAEHQVQLPRGARLTDLATAMLTEPGGGGSGGEQASSADDAAPGWVWRRGACVALARLDGMGPNGPEVDYAIVLDDREETVAGPDFRAEWRAWLSLSNLAAASEFPAAIATVTSLAQAPPIPEPVVREVPEGPWAELFEMAIGDVEQGLVVALARHADELPLPEIGLELADGIPASLTWSSLHITVAVDLAENEVDQLEQSGWQIVQPEVDAILTAVKGR